MADEVVLLDIKEGVSEGKAMDIMQTANILGTNTRLVGVTNDYAQTEGSDVVVITSGIPRMREYHGKRQSASEVS